MPTKLIDFWPDSDNCRDCLFTEAEAADEAVFLAVHQPMKMVRQYYGNSAKSAELVVEEDVLAALLVPEPSSGTLVLPITGASGAGKSHMIRWLDAHLNLRRDRDKRHVVRIPKSSSLRGVLDLILKNLPKKYDPIRNQLDGARMPTTLLAATQLLNTQLRIALEILGKEAEQRIKDRREKMGDRARTSHCAERGLIALLRDPEISKHFDSHDKELGVIARIAERFLHGNKQHAGVEKFAFHVDDLAFLDDQSTAALSSATRIYAAQLRRPDTRAEAIGFLNEVIDSALNKMVELGGASLTDIFIDLRRELWADKLELVLLIEDFAVLAGIQRPLMDAMIKEGIRDGRRELCIMRTALAVTSGLLPETVMTRAQAVWSIDSKPYASADEAIENFCDFVGGYLNAARLGTKRLRAAFDEKGVKNDWVPSYYEEVGEQLSDTDKRLLTAFGTSKRGEHPLFPLNRLAITELANLNVKEGETYRFDPRTLMHRIIRETLVTNRTPFATKSFPPSNFGGFSNRLLETRVSSLIQNTAGGQADRASAMVYFWGGAPRTAGEAAAVPNEIFEAFGIEIIDWKAKPESRSPATTSGPAEKLETQTATVEGRWGPVLTEWRTKGTLAQRDANSIRNMLVDGIGKWMDWDALLLVEVPLNGGDIWLPKVKVGNPNSIDKAMAVVATDDVMHDVKATNEFFTAIAAVVRYDLRRNWDYEDGEIDAAAYANLISRLSAETALWLDQRGPYLRPALVESVGRALLIDARVLNLPGASAITDAENQRAMLAAAPANEPPGNSDAWSRLKAGAHSERAALLAPLLRRLAARQGGGQPQAVDGAVLLGAIKATRTSWSLANLPAELLNEATSGIREPLRRLRNNLEEAVRRRQEEVTKWLTLVISSFGEEFVLTEVQEQMRTTLLKARENGVFRLRDGNYETLRLKVKNVGALSDAVAQASRATKADTPFGTTLAALAQLDEEVVTKSKDLIDNYSRFLKETGTDVREKLKDAPPSPDTIAATIVTHLDSLDAEWTNMLEDTRR